MKKAYWFTLLAMVLSLLVVTNAYLYKTHYQRTHFHCQGVAVVVNGNDSVNALFSLTLSGDIGQFSVDGKVAHQSEGAKIVSRMTSVRVKQHGDDLYLTNYSVSELLGNTASDAMLKNLIPAYFIASDVSAKLNIYPISGKSFLIANDQDMSIYCKK